jgi:hypothetical protein
MPGAAFRAAIALLLAATGAAMAQPGVSDTTAYAKDPFDPAWADDADVKAFLDWEKANLTQAIRATAESSSATSPHSSPRMFCKRRDRR